MAVLFAAGLVLYNVSYALTRNVLINQLQVRPATWLLSQTLPNLEIWSRDPASSPPGLNWKSAKGCDGMEVWLMLATALLAFPMPLAGVCAASPMALCWCFR